MVSEESDPRSESLVSWLRPDHRQGLAWQASLGKLPSAYPKQDVDPSPPVRFLPVHLHYSPGSSYSGHVSSDSVPSTSHLLLSPPPADVSVRIEEAQDGAGEEVPDPRDESLRRSVAG